MSHAVEGGAVDGEERGPVVLVKGCLTASSSLHLGKPGTGDNLEAKNKKTELLSPHPPPRTTEECEFGPVSRWTNRILIHPVTLIRARESQEVSTFISHFGGLTPCREPFLVLVFRSAISVRTYGPLSAKTAPAPVVIQGAHFNARVNLAR